MNINKQSEKEKNVGPSVRFQNRTTIATTPQTTTSARAMPVTSQRPQKELASKEGLIISSFILVCIFSIMQIIFNSVWSESTVAFQMLSGVIFIMFIIIAIVGIRLIILERKRILAHEREGFGLFIIGSLITVLLPITGAIAGQYPEAFFSNNLLVIDLGIILILIGAFLIAWFGGFFSIWLFGLTYYIVMSSHEAFLIMIYTHHYGPYDQYYGTLGVFIILISILLFLYHELKFFYLGRLIKRANFLRAQGRFIEAIKPLKRALKIYPRYATAWNNKGNVYFNLGSYEKALRCYDKALVFSPGFAIAKQNRALVIYKMTG